MDSFERAICGFVLGEEVLEPTIARLWREKPTRDSEVSRWPLSLPKYSISGQA